MSRLPVVVEDVSVHIDRRGAVFEPLSPEGLGEGWSNVHVVLTRPGAVRGNHLHRRGTETLTVSGPALVAWEEEGRWREREVPEGRAVRFTFPPGVPHAVKATGPGPCVLAAFNTEPHDPSDPDVVPRELL